MVGRRWDLYSGHCALTTLSKRQMCGLSLVEVMVAITISLILGAGIIQLLVANKQAYRIQSGASLLNDNARFALQQIGASVRMADHWGGIEADAMTIDSGLPATVTKDCNGSTNTWTFSTTGIEGKEGQTGSPLTNCIPNADYVDNSDILVLRYAGPAMQNCAGLTATTTYVRTQVGSSGVIYEGQDSATALASYGACPGGTNPNYDAPDGASDLPYVVEAYFIRPCSNQGSNNVCDSTDDDGNPIPTLARLSLSGSTITQEDVVEGVESMQVVYGLDTDSDGDAEVYERATTVSTAEWAEVVSVRINLLVRNPEVDPSITDTSTYNMGLQTGTDNYTIPASHSHYKRKVITSVLQIRNRARS